MTDQTITLRQAIETTPAGHLLNDGGESWAPENLIDSFTENDPDTLDDPETRYYVDDIGIFRMKPDGYQESQALWTFEPDPSAPDPDIEAAIQKENIERAAGDFMTRTGYDWASFTADEFTKFAGAVSAEWSDEDKAAYAIIEANGAAVLIVDASGSHWFAPDDAETYENFILRMARHDD